MFKESIRNLFNWILNNSEYELFLKLRLINKEFNNIGIQEFNNISGKEKIIFGRDSCICISECMVCEKNYKETFKEKNWLIIERKDFFQNIIVYCDELKCKMNLIKSMNISKKKGCSSFFIENENILVNIIRTNGIKENDWMIISGKLKNFELFIYINKKDEILTKYVPYKDLKKLNPELLLQFKTPFLINRKFTNWMEQTNIGIKFNQKYENPFEGKYHP